MTESSSQRRLSSIDWLRGLIMALMLVDHIREFLLAESLWQDPTDLSVISTATFLTRWITHFCAPIFVLLAGTSVALQLKAGKSPAFIRRFLWTRGVWLIFLEFTLVRMGSSFRWAPWATVEVCQVIWAIGISMILFAFLIRLPWPWILATGLALTFGHNLLDPVVVTSWQGPGTPFPDALGSIWTVIHQGGFIAPFGNHGPLVRIDYPLIPWPGVMALGYCLGTLFEKGAEDRRKNLVGMGLVCLALFVVLRSVNHYGDSARWMNQATPFRTILSFLNTTKYPPSLLYLLMTLGPGLLLLAWREGRQENLLDQGLVVFGRVPLFFYLLQWPTAHGLSVLFHAIASKDWHFAFHFQGAIPSNAGFSLSVVFLAWLTGLALLFPLCRWFSTYKARHKTWWLSYL